MRKNIFCFVALLFVAQMSWAASVTSPANIPSYWSSANGKSGAGLWSAVSSQTNVGYSSIGYKNLYTAYKKTDVYPADSVGKAGKIWDMYGECDFATSNTCGNYDGVCDCYNREHSIPQSWFGGGTSGIGCDIFHVLPTDGKVNGVRSNYEYGEVNGGTNWVGNKFGSAGSWSTDKKTIASAAGESVNGAGNVFEPKPQYKGDIARGLMGAIIKWQHSSLTSGNNFFNSNYTVSGNFGLTKKAVVLLMKWHREDPVSQKEIDRNNGIQETQGNRNPFIDYPYLAEYIWGEKAGETVDMSKLMPSTDPDFIPGKSNGWRGKEEPPTPPTPPTPTIKYGVTWSVCGKEIAVDSIGEDTQITALPETPVSCSAESPVFMGWTDAPIAGIADEEPAKLYRQVTQFPIVTEDVTYYAVFANEIIIEGGTVPTKVLFDFNDMGLSGEVKNPFEKDGVTVTFAKANAGTAPTYYTGDPGAIRLYARGTMTVSANAITQIDFTFGASDKNNEIKANVGSFTSPTWTGEADEVIFTIDGTSGHRKIASVNVSMSGSGSSLSYERFITNYQETTEVEMLDVDAPARKILVGGQIYILLGEQLFNIQGQRVK